MKTCTKCGKSKPLDAFSKYGGKRDGLRSSCRDCRSIEKSAWYAENAHKCRASDAKWSAANKDKERASDAKYRAANRNKYREAVAKWSAANPEARRVSNQNRRAMKRANGGKLSKEISIKLFWLQRGKCACGCKQTLGSDYHLDHIMPLALGGANTDDNIQLLRAECNLRKSKKHPVEFMQLQGFLL